MEKARILLAIYHEILRDGIEIILTNTGEYQISNSVKSWNDLRELTEDEYDILILDLDIPGLKVPDHIANIKNNHPGISILALSGPRKAFEIKEVLKRGSSGFLFKRRGKDELQHALDMIIEGGQYLCEDTIDILVGDGESSHESVGSLTKREVEILDLICNEYTNKQIAEMLHISIRTVDAHRRNLLQKTGANNTAGLVKYAVRNDICTP